MTYNIFQIFISILAICGIIIVLYFSFLTNVHWSNKLRIVKKTTLDKQVSFQIQKRFLFIFWFNATDDCSLYMEKLCFRNAIDAKRYIDKHNSRKIAIKNSKIIKKEVLKDFEIHNRALLIEKKND